MKTITAEFIISATATLSGGGGGGIVMYESLLWLRIRKVIFPSLRLPPWSALHLLGGVYSLRRTSRRAPLQRRVILLSLLRYLGLFLFGILPGSLDLAAPLVSVPCSVPHLQGFGGIPVSLFVLHRRRFQFSCLDTLNFAFTGRFGYLHVVRTNNCGRSISRITTLGYQARQISKEGETLTRSRKHGRGKDSSGTRHPYYPW